MITLKETMLKMSVSGISEIVNPTVMDIIYEFDSSPNLSSLIDILLEVYTPKGILSDKKKLVSILEHLPAEPVNELANRLNIDNSEDDPWKFIKHLSITRLPEILQFFGIEYYPEDNEDLALAPSVVSVEPIYPLFPHQEKATKEIKQHFGGACSGRKLLLHMPTGAGKTRTSMNVTCDFFRNVINRTQDEIVIWLADTEELCDQAAEEFINAWSTLGVGAVNLYRFYGEYDHEIKAIQKGFVVAGLHKLNSRLTKDQSGMIALARKTKLIIFDEAHKILAPTYQHIVELFQSVGNPDLLGLSATPGRATFDIEQNVRFAEFFNYNKIDLKIEGYSNPIEYLQDSGYLAKVNYVDIPFKPEDLTLTKADIESISNKENIPDRVLKALGDDTKRNVKLIDVALREVEAGSKIILFACSIQNAEAIFAILAYKGVKVGMVTGFTNKDVRRKTIEDYKTGVLDVLVNYGVLTTGFDAPITNVAVIGRPTTSLTLYSQMVGRASRGRKAGGNEECTVYTVTDDLPGFRNMADAFKYWDEAWT